MSNEGNLTTKNRSQNIMNGNTSNIYTSTGKPHKTTYGAVLRREARERAARAAAKIAAHTDRLRAA